MNVRYLLWDLDGTLVESENPKFKGRVFAHASESIGLRFDLKPDEYIGHEARSIYNEIVRRSGHGPAPLRDDRYADWYESAVGFIKRHAADVPARENVVDIWRQIGALGIVHCVVTSSRRDVAERYLANLGLVDEVRRMVCIDHVHSPKPDPEPYERMLACIGDNQGLFVAVEDSPSGVRSARAAGVFVIGWYREGGSALIEANAVTSRLTTADILAGFADVRSRPPVLKPHLRAARMEEE